MKKLNKIIIIKINIITINIIISCVLIKIFYNK